MANLILIVEDDKEIHQMLSAYLQENEYQTDSAFDGRQASAKIRVNDYDLILMDMMLPYKDGATLIKELREKSDTPVIVISAKSLMETRLEVLRLGADDYILKPFDLDEVLVRMEVILRRTKKDAQEDNMEKAFFYEDFAYYPEEGRLLYQDTNVSLTAKERKLLQLFLEHPQKTFSKANLYETVWEDTYCYEDNTINVHVSNLRSKLKKASGLECIETVWGIGYRLKEIEG